MPALEQAVGSIARAEVVVRNALQIGRRRNGMHACQQCAALARRRRRLVVSYVGADEVVRCRAVHLQVEGAGRRNSMVGKEPVESGLLAQEAARIDMVIVVVADEARSWRLDGNVAPDRVDGMKNPEMESLADKRQVRTPRRVADLELQPQRFEGSGHAGEGARLAKAAVPALDSGSAAADPPSA